MFCFVLFVNVLRNPTTLAPNCTHTRPYETGSQVKITNVSVRMAFIQISFSHKVKQEYGYEIS